MSQTSIVFLFDHPLALRSYQETRELDKFNSIYPIVKIILLNQQESLDEPLAFPFKKVSFSKVVTSLNTLIAYSYWHEVRKRSKSIATRFNFSNLKADLGLLGTGKLFAFLLLPKSALFVLMCFFEKYVKSEIQKHLKVGKLKVVYVSVGGPTSLSDYLNHLGSKMGFEVITILENWDNISSKGVFWIQPFRIAVWGKQSIDLGQKIHTLSPERIFDFGNPRVEFLRNRISFKPVESNSILFAGGSVEYSQELEYLEFVSRFLYLNKFGFNLKYLPHPKNYSKTRENIKFLEDLGIEVINRNDIVSTYKESVLKLPKLELYVECFSSVGLVISPLSTMSLEARILGIPSVGLDFVVTSGNNCGRYTSELHDHLDDARKRGLIKMVRSKEELEEILDLLEAPNLLSRACYGDVDVSYLYAAASSREELLI